MFEETLFTEPDFPLKQKTALSCRAAWVRVTNDCYELMTERAVKFLTFSFYRGCVLFRMTEIQSVQKVI
jgi:hypothetical protein